MGLEPGTQAPPGIYVEDLVYVYPTDTIKDNNGNSIPLPGSITSTADLILFNAVSDVKILGGNFGGNLGLGWIKNRIQLNSLDVSSGFAFTDMFGGLNLGWHLERADVLASYNIYIPTGKFEPGANDNTGLGIWANEPAPGITPFLDQKKLWHAGANFAVEFNSDKRDTNIHPGTIGTVEGGLGRTFYKKSSGPIPIVMNLGAAGYSQWKFTHDSGSDIPLALRGYKDYVFALGPEFNVFLPGPRLSFVVRYEPEFGAHVRTQGSTVLFSIAWVAKSLVKVPPHT